MIYVMAEDFMLGIPEMILYNYMGIKFHEPCTKCGNNN